MVTDEMLEAYDALVEMMPDADGVRMATALREMLCDFDDFRWRSGSESERKEWLEQFLV